MLKPNPRSFLILALVVFASSAVIIPQAFASPPKGWAAHPPIHAKPLATTVPTGLFPSMIEHAYDLDQLSCSLGSASISWTDPSLCGHGQALAIVDAYDDPTAESDLGTFTSYFGLPACTSSNGCFVKATPQGQPSSDQGWSLEISLDIQWAHAIAPGARIILVEAASNSFANLLGAVSYAASQSGYPVHQVSMSWGGSEFFGETLYDSYFSVSGVNFFASSGDSGSGTIWPSASPYVIGVGGTTLQPDSLVETAWSGSGGGISLYESEPSFQANYPIPNTSGARGIPDVSFDADPNTGVSVFDSTGYKGQSGWFVVGGTSVGAPSWNAIFAIINSQLTNPISSVSYGTGTTLYAAATGSAYASNYRDITSGSNGNCGFVCTAQVGYDFVTGLGSPLANHLVPYLQPSPALSLSATPNVITTSQTSTITASTNDGKSGITITLSLASGSVGSLSSNTCTTTSGQCSVTFSSGTAGTATVMASASGYNSAQTTVTVNQQPPPSLSVSANPTTITTAQTSTITVSASDGKSGVAVSFSSNIGSFNPPGCTTGGTGTCSVTFSSSVTGTATITATATSYTSGQTTVTVNPTATPTLSVSVVSSKGSYRRGQIVTLTVTVTSSGTPVSGATVSMTVYYPAGNPAPPVAPRTTNSKGQAAFLYIVTSSAPTGTYKAVATASLTGYTSGSGSTTFSVK